MSWLLIVVLAIIVIAAIRGAYKGFLRLLFSFVAVVLLIGLVAYATPHISNYIQTHTNIGTSISEHFAEKIEVSMESAVDATVQNQEEQLETAGIHLPSIIQEALFETGVEKAEDAIAGTGVYQQMGDQMAGIVLAILSFLIALVIALVIVLLIGKFTDLANKVPVVKGINRFFGFWAGGFLGFVIVWLLFLLISIISGSEVGQLFLGEIEKSRFLSALYNDNLILKIIMGFFSKNTI